MPDPVIRAQGIARVIDPESDDPGKGQLTRLADVFVFGPYMIWTARSVPHRYLRAGLTLIGIGTIIYNGWNYLRIGAAQRGSPAPELAGASRGLRAPGLRELERYSLQPGRRRPPPRRALPRSFR